MFKYKGYTGKILRVDLSSGKIHVEELQEGFARLFLGGLGFAAKILWDETSEKTDPLSPENRLIYATGPINGAFFPPSGRFTIAARSPLTGVWGEAHPGGHFGPELKYAGYDMIIFSGRSEKPVYLYVDDGRAELKDASEVWGKSTWEATDIIREIHGDSDIKVSVIGQAGENL